MESNQRPPPYQGGALPTELSERKVFTRRFLMPFSEAVNGAGDGNRTRTSSLEGYSSTIELLPPGDTFRLRLENRADLRQTRSYSQKKRHKTAKNSWWREVDSNHRRHEPADLQSAPVGRLGIPPVFQPFFLQNQREIGRKAFLRTEPPIVGSA